MIKELESLITNPGIKLIYGEGGSGKTTICLEATNKFLKESKKVIYIDTSANFSIERIKQMSPNIKLNNIFLLRIRNFNEQHQQIQKLEGGIKGISLIIIDSITHFYRRLYSREPELAKGMLGKQIKILNAIENTPIIITSEVYDTMEKDIQPLGKEIVKRHANEIIKLNKTPRKIFFLKPELGPMNFKIVDEGITLEL